MTDSSNINLKHKEEPLSRIKNDASDLDILEEALSMYINPLDPDKHLKGKLQNIVTGQVAPDSVNVDDAFAIGRRQMIEFRSSCPDDFYKAIKKEVILFNVKERHILIGDTKIFDLNLIYVRAMGLLISKRDLNFDDIISYECSPLPASEFDGKGVMRAACSKSTLKAKLQVEVNARHVFHRSEERRVGKECRSRWSPYH